MSVCHQNNTWSSIRWFDWFMSVLPCKQLANSWTAKGARDCDGAKQESGKHSWIEWKLLKFTATFSVLQASWRMSKAPVFAGGCKQRAKAVEVFGSILWQQLFFQRAFLFSFHPFGDVSMALVHFFNTHSWSIELPHLPWKRSPDDRSVKLSSAHQSWIPPHWPDAMMFYCPTVSLCIVKWMIFHSSWHFHCLLALGSLEATL